MTSVIDPMGRVIHRRALLPARRREGFAAPERRDPVALWSGGSRPIGIVARGALTFAAVMQGPLPRGRARSLGGGRLQPVHGGSAARQVVSA